MADTVTRFGFTFGPAEVVRLFRNEKLGAWLLVRGKRQEIEIRVTKSGLLRVSKPRKPGRQQPHDPMA